MKIVLDTMAILHLTSLNLLEELKRVFYEVLVPSSAFEVLKEGNEGYPDAIVAENLIRRGLLKVTEALNKQTLKELEIFGLRKPETEAIEIYIQERADILASDDEALSESAQEMGLNMVGTPALIYLLFKKKIIDKDKAINCLIQSKNWFRSEDIDSILEEFKRREGERKSY